MGGREGMGMEQADDILPRKQAAHTCPPVSLPSAYVLDHAAAAHTPLR